MTERERRELAAALRTAAVAADARLSKFSPLPRILAYDSFDSGTHGWCELIGNYDGTGSLDTIEEGLRDLRPPQLSACDFFDIGTHGAESGTYALKLATRPVTGHTAAAIRRLIMSGRGRVQLETYFSFKAEVQLGGGPAAEHFGSIAWNQNVHPSLAQFGSLTIGTDICGHRGLRYHCVARYQNTDMEHQLTQQWIYPTAPEPTSREESEHRTELHYTDDFTAPRQDWKPFGERQELCYNEVPTKVNWHYLRWVFDTAERHNIELQVNDRVMDMRHIPVPPHEERFRALENLLNFYFSVRTHAPIRNFLYLDSVLISVDW